ncbi:MAG: hypothetical protein ACLUSK_08940 [Bacteroides stercoris]
MDQNSPEDIFTLGEYLGREQYGTRPLFYGSGLLLKGGPGRERRILRTLPATDRHQIRP